MPCYTVLYYPGISFLCASAAVAYGKGYNLILTSLDTNSEKATKPKRAKAHLLVDIADAETVGDATLVGLNTSFTGFG